MHAFQHMMFTPINRLYPLLRRRSPCKKDDAFCSDLGDRVNDLLRELFPPLVGMAICLMRLNGEASVQHQHSTIRPWSEETAVLGGSYEGRVVLLDGNVHVLERWRSRRGRADREAKTMSLVEVVVGILP